MNDTSYAPQSPDLSFLSPEGKSSEPYRPRSPRIPGALSQQQQQQQQQQPSTQYTAYQHYEAEHPSIPPLPNAHSEFGSYQRGPIHSPTKQPTSQYHPFSTSSPSSFSSSSYNQPPSVYQQFPPTTYQQIQSNPIPIKQEHQLSPNHSYPTPNNSYPSYASTPFKAMAQQAASSSSGRNGLGPSQGIEIRTKFPVARIKRIMQADEEVGKVAQVTPVAVSKALELFMISLCSKSAEIARTGNSKRITATHLKAAIEKDDQFDFLSEIVSKIADPQESGGGGEAGAGEKKGRGRAKAEVKSDGDSDEPEKKVKSTRGRKKKVVD